MRLVGGQEWVGVGGNGLGGLGAATSGGWAVVGTGPGPGRDEGGMGAEAEVARYLYRKRNPFQ